MEQCLTKDQILQAPQEGLTYPSYGQQTPPFTLNGAPVTNLPQTLVGAVLYERLSTATKDTSNFLSYFARDNYKELKLQGENVLPPDVNTTLRYNQKSFTLKFTLLHKAIWGEGLQVSLFFESNQSNSKTFFHMCIPVVIGGESDNLFLTSWLGRKPVGATGMTVNEVLNFRGSESDVRFATLEFCLKYNVRTQLNGQDIFDLRPYTFCIFKNSISIQPQSCPEWLKEDPTLSKGNRLSTFDMAFNYYYRVMKLVLDQRDPFVLSSEQHFDSTRSQNVVKPSFFKTTVAIILGRPLSNKQVKEGVRGLQNVKCYPIDLAHQVDDGGNIYIDQTTNKPVPIQDAIQDGNSLKFPDEVDGSEALNAGVKGAEQASRVRFWIAFAVIMLILLAILTTIIVFVFRGSSFSKTEFVPANTPSLNR